MLLVPPSSASSSRMVKVDPLLLMFITRAKIHSSGAPGAEMRAATWSPCLMGSSEAFWLPADPKGPPIDFSLKFPKKGKKKGQTRTNDARINLKRRTSALVVGPAAGAAAEALPVLSTT